MQIHSANLAWHSSTDQHTLMPVQSMLRIYEHNLEAPLVSVVCCTECYMQAICCQCTHAGPLDSLPETHHSIAQVAGTLVV